MTNNTELSVIVNGDLSVESNIDAYKKHVLSELKKADKDLKTDKDFAEADQLVKNLDAGAKALRERKTEILKQAEDVYEVIAAIDEMDESMTIVKRKLKRKITDKKASLKDELRDDAYDRCADMMKELRERFPMVSEPNLQISDRLDKAMYRKSSLDSMRLSLDAVVDEVKAELSNFGSMFQANHDLLEGIDPSFMAAFQDTVNLMNMGTDLLTAEIATRIERQKRIQAEQQAEEEREKSKQDKKRAEDAEMAALEAGNTTDLPPEPDQDNKTQDQATYDSAESEIVVPAATESVLQDQEFIVFFRFRGTIESAKGIASRVNEAIKSEYGTIGETFLTTPTKLKERFSND